MGDVNMKKGSKELRDPGQVGLILSLAKSPRGYRAIIWQFLTCKLQPISWSYRDNVARPLR